MTIVPVYLFTGFLDSGKTRFIQETLEDERFNKGERTLLLLCEEGEEEYDPSRFSGRNVFIENIDDPEDIDPERLAKLLKSLRCQRVIVEYNGMWPLENLLNGLPLNWRIAQEFCFADASTIMTYNANMRNLVADKLQNCELVVFNRFSPGTDQMPYHQLVRNFNRRADIAYEAPDGNVTYDEIEDPLPFDKNADIIDIAPEAYAIWYRDLSEDMKFYDGKTVRLLGLANSTPFMAKNEFVFGRNLMTCCENDIQFAGLICRTGTGSKPSKGRWIMLTAKISIEAHSSYKGPGPVLRAIEYTPAEAPENPVATFF